MNLVNKKRQKGERGRELYKKSVVEAPVRETPAIRPPVDGYGKLRRTVQVTPDPRLGQCHGLPAQVVSRLTPAEVEVVAPLAIVGNDDVDGVGGHACLEVTRVMDVDGPVVDLVLAGPTGRVVHVTVVAHARSVDVDVEVDRLVGTEVTMVADVGEAGGRGVAPKDDALLDLVSRPPGTGTSRLRTVG